MTSQKFQRDAAQEDLCPLCGSKVLYRGFNSVECAGAPLVAVPESWDYSKSVWVPAVEGKPACPNFKPLTLSLDFGFPMWIA